MGSDMLVALRDASANGTTLFALNYHAVPLERHCVVALPGRMHDTGAILTRGGTQIPQARQTFSVLGVQAVGQWGLVHGVNEQRVAIGATPWRSRLPAGSAPLCGPDLVRLTLERSRGALQAVEVLADLLDRVGSSSDDIYLIADAREAYVLESCSRFWALLECGHTRVVTDAAMIRQDWSRLAPGLFDHVLERGWWKDDGSKIDFVRCLSEASEQSAAAQKRWGRASLMMAQQLGAIDAHFLRRMLADHYTSNRDLLSGRKPMVLASSFVADLHKSDAPLVAWIAFGPPKTAVYFPICLAGELPAELGEGTPACPSIQQRVQELVKLGAGKEKDRNKLALSLERLQARFDQDADEFEQRATDYLHHGKPYLISQIATEMMHQHVAMFEREYRAFLGIETPSGPHQPAETPEEALFYA